MLDQIRKALTLKGNGLDRTDLVQNSCYILAPIWTPLSPGIVLHNPIRYVKGYAGCHRMTIVKPTSFFSQSSSNMISLATRLRIHACTLTVSHKLCVSTRSVKACMTLEAGLDVSHVSFSPASSIPILSRFCFRTW